MTFEKQTGLPSLAPELTLVVPCLNEAENISEVLSRLDELRGTIGANGLEVLIVDDASEDDTFARATSAALAYPALQIRVLRRQKPRRGYGAVVRYALAHANGEYAVPIAADLVDPIDLIPEFLRRVRQGADLVQISRYMKDGDSSTIPWSYWICQVIWRTLVSLLFQQHIPDTTYAFRIFRRRNLLAMGLSSMGFNLSPEIFFKSLLAGARIEYIPRAQGVRQRGQSKFRFLREGPGYAYVMARATLHRFGLLPWF